MLTIEECELLGLAQDPPARRRPSAISQVLRAVRDNLECPSPIWEMEGKAVGAPGYRMLVASTRAKRERAYALAQATYQGCGYAAENANGWCVTPFDAHPESFTLLAEDEQERAASTISLVFDASGGLPCDAIFGAELSRLRAQGRRVVEVTRLAIAEEHTTAKMLLVRLFNFIYIYARRVKGFDDFVIEVNPRHVNYYRRLLGFELFGPERPCPRVNGAPAVLLRLDLSLPEREIRRVAGKGSSAGERSLYPYFYTWLEEGAVAEFLAHEQRPMSAEERAYFMGSAESVCATPLAAAR